ncbi:Global transcription regulator sge1 [Lithohypha guttulata]|nr:Global transcription regulator sge1 [Lithohypha guttulata]
MAIIHPTFTGYVATTQDALILFEACLQGSLPLIPRRIHDGEKDTLIRSGSVFVYEEKTSSIQRWTDGVVWSPSRSLDKFLVYRELDRPFPPGEKKRTIEKRNQRVSTVGGLCPASGQYPGDDAFSKLSIQRRNNGLHATNAERQLVGSLVGSYNFKASGLVKKTMSVRVHEAMYHLVSYYSMEDVMCGSLHTPYQTGTFHHVQPRPALGSMRKFRFPVGNIETVNEAAHQASPSHEYNGQTPVYYSSQLHPPVLEGLPAIPQYPGSVPFESPHALQTMLHTTQMDLDLDRSGYGQYNNNLTFESIPSVLTDFVPTLLPGEIYQQWNQQCFIEPSTSTLSSMP